MYKMNLKSLTKLAAVLTLVLASERGARATAITNTLAVSLTVVVPGAELTSSDSPIVTDLVDKQKLTNKQVLGYLATSVGDTNIAAAGNIIEVVIPDAGTNIVSVKNRSGDVVLDASNFISLTFDHKDIFARQLNTNTLQEVRTAYPLMTFTFNDNNGKQLTVTGLATDKYTASAKSSGTQHESSTLSATVSGEAVWDALTSVANGVIMLKGKDVIPAN